MSREKVTWEGDMESDRESDIESDISCDVDGEIEEEVSGFNWSSEFKGLTKVVN